ncbi:hydrolase [Aureococcus anophagefferens]|nr:hydrolase [Aureococcus anophagefferens]
MSALDASKAGAQKKGKPPRRPGRGAATAAATKKERDPAAEAAALRGFGVGCALVDCGANLQGRHGFDETARLLDRAALAGVGRVVLTGCDVAGSRSGVAFCERRSAAGEKGLYATAGVHPHDAKTWDDATAAELRAIAASPHCVALGECGLDYDRMFAARRSGASSRRSALARDLGKPLWVHVREVDAPGAPLGAYADAIAILGASGLDQRACVHCFTGPAELAPSDLRRAYVPAALGKQLGLRGGKNEPAVLPAVARASRTRSAPTRATSRRRRRPPPPPSSPSTPRTPRSTGN